MAPEVHAFKTQNDQKSLPTDHFPDNCSGEGERVTSALKAFDRSGAAAAEQAAESADIYPALLSNCISTGGRTHQLGSPCR